MKTALSPLALLLLGTAAPLAAQDIELAPITVFSNLTETELNRTGTTVDVVNETAIQTSTNASDVLDRLPGVSLTRNGGPGSSTTLRLRGLGTSYIGVRMDGLDISDPSSAQTAFNFGGLMSTGLGRAEVLKGSQSALYGSEAIAGVVNFQTKRPEHLGFSGEVTAEAGSYGTRIGGVTLSQMSDNGFITLHVGRSMAEGFSNRDSDTEKDGFEKTEARLVGEFDLSDRVTAGFSALASNDATEYDLGFGSTAGEIEQKRRGGRVFLRYSGDVIEHELAVSTFTNDRYDAVGFTKSFIGKRDSIEYVGSASLGDTGSVSFGFDVTHESSNTDGATADAMERAVFAEVQYAISPSVDVAFSARRDMSDDFAAANSFRLSMAARLTDDLILRGVAATGFRAPSLYERFGPYGNTALTPEESRSYELGLEKQYGNGSNVRITAFHTEIDNMIGYDFLTSSYNQVPGQTTTRGVELAGRAQLSDRLAMFGSYTLTDAQDSVGQLARVPRQDLVLGVEAQITDRLKGEVTVNHIADRVDVIAWPARSAMPDVTTVNMGVTYEVREGTEAYLRIENLTDTDYQSVAGYNAAGRSAYFGVRASF